MHALGAAARGASKEPLCTAMAATMRGEIAESSVVASV